MKKLSGILFLLLITIAAEAQNRYPEFKNEPTELKIPANMLGVRPDYAIDGFITYNVSGHLFKEGENNVIQERADGFNGKTDKATPYETLTELVDVVRRRKWKDLMALYTKDSRKKAEAIVPADKREQYFDALNTTKEVKVVLGMEYNNMYVVMIQNTDKSISPVFFQKVKNEYMMVAVTDSSAKLWNIGTYLRFKPGPMSAAQLAAKPDSVKLNSVLKLSFNLSQPGNRILLFRNEINTTVIITAQDNGPGDLNTAQGAIELHLDGAYLPARKQYTILALESNYPTIKVTEDMPQKATRISFKVY